MAKFTRDIKMQTASYTFFNISVQVLLNPSGLSLFKISAFMEQPSFKVDIKKVKHFIAFKLNFTSNSSCFHTYFVVMRNYSWENNAKLLYQEVLLLLCLNFSQLYENE
jgi:hypothetical protein